MNYEERVCEKIKKLFENYGFKRYKLSSFDEYSVYSENLSFFGGKDVISFSAGGKLLALRPDVTLSIIKNGRFGKDTQKLFYDEKVYRKTPNGSFAEVSQLGAEVIGNVDILSEAELCLLALKTLSAVGRDYVLDLSHTGAVSKIMEKLGVSDSDKKIVLRCLESKNADEFKRFAEEKKLNKDAVESIVKLMTVPSERARDVLGEISGSIDLSEELKELDEIINFAANGKINIDFSLGGDTEYYNGLFFKGYVKGVPRAVLSGGRYDGLLKKFKKGESAAGFALYLGEICKYTEDKPSRPDAVLVYGGGNARTALIRAEKLRSEGIGLLTAREIPEGFEGEIYYAENGDD